MARGLILAAVALTAAGLAWLAFDRRSGGPEEAPARTENGTTPAAETLEHVDLDPVPEGDPGRSVVATARSDSPPSEHAGEVATAVLSGTAVEADAGAPIPGLALTIGVGEELLEVVTDAHGRFRVETPPVHGVVRFDHEPDGSPGPNRLYRPITPAFLLVDGSHDEALRHVELRVHAPPEEFLIDVFDAGGRPSPEAEVSVFLEGEDGLGLPADRTMRGWTDERGRHRFLVHGGLEPWSRLTVLAMRGEEVSPSTVWTGPLQRGPYEVQLALGAAIDVTVLGEVGPYADIEVFAGVVDDESGLRRYSSGSTDADGRLRLSPLAAGSYRVRAYDMEAGRWARGTVEVRSGEAVALTLTFPPGDPAPPLAAAGRVVDEKGLPLAGVNLLCLGDNWEHTWWNNESVETKEDGSFEWRTDPMRSVRIHPLISEDRFDPPFAEVPFGTTDLLFRRTVSVEEREVLFLVRDGETGNDVSDAEVMCLLPSSFHNYVTETTFRGEARLELKLHDDALVVTDARGYRRDTRRLLDALERTEDGLVCRIDLVRGFLREVQILDDATDEPIAGAVLEHEGVRVATTDARGRATVELAAWPREITVRVEGYRATTWAPVEDVDYPEPAWLWISREP
ncbi:MAG: carboxypeptidase-like regulatory domain-containing protein [Planctomycetota bacterium]|nr:carboxypeptidase-like regulatory domain-containing protein [Planctomycetota bacterium]